MPCTIDAASCIKTPRVLAINRPVSIPPPHWRPRHATYPSLSECAKPPACQLTLSIKGTQTGYRRSECLVRKFCTSEGPRWPWKSVQSLASADAKKACPASRLSLECQCFGRVSSQTLSKVDNSPKRRKFQPRRVTNKSKTSPTWGSQLLLQKYSHQKRRSDAVIPKYGSVAKYKLRSEVQDT